MIVYYEAEDLTSQGLDISGTIPVLDEVLTLLSISDPNYLFELESLYETPSSTSQILDTLGALFGLKRNLSVTYYDEDQETDVTEKLSLSDADFLTYIKCQIIKNNFDGSYKQFKLYNDLAGLNIGIRTNTTVDADVSHGEVALYVYNFDQMSNELQKLFISGNLTLSSVGISYQYLHVDTSTLLIWQGSQSSVYQNNWDEGVWSK